LRFLSNPISISVQTTSRANESRRHDRIQNLVRPLAGRGRKKKTWSSELLLVRQSVFENLKGSFRALDRMAFLAAGVDRTQAPLFDRSDRFIDATAQLDGIGFRESCEIIVLPRVHGLWAEARKSNINRSLQVREPA
jgi:hypothetical protein